LSLCFCFQVKVGFLIFLWLWKPPKKTNFIIIILEKINLWIWGFTSAVFFAYNFFCAL
jgi:hypothetical protein